MAEGRDVLRVSFVNAGENEEVVVTEEKCLLRAEGEVAGGGWQGR